jgi:acyl-CoA thioester hydrolase
MKPRATRADYAWFCDMPTRWMDNDVYGHVNNVIYYSWFDTAVARFLLELGVVEGPAAPAIGVVVETQCRYLGPIAFPDAVTIGLRVERIGTTSIRYGVAAFRGDEATLRAEGHFVHVYVASDRQDQPVPLPGLLRSRAASYIRPA